jgi:hypothetical protein
MLERQGHFEEIRGRRELLQELNLDVSTDELLSAERAFTYADLHAMLGNGNTFLWLTPHAAVVPRVWRTYVCYHRQDYFSFRLNVDGKEVDAWARSWEAFSDVLDVLRRLVLADVREVYEIKLIDFSYIDETFFNAAT